MKKIEEAAVSLYRQGYTLSGVARRLELSNGKTRKILITHGSYSTPLSRRIAQLHAQGMTDAQIARTLRINAKSVNTYLPYENGIYGAENPTYTAAWLRQWRARKREAENPAKAEAQNAKSI